MIKEEGMKKYILALAVMLVAFMPSVFALEAVTANTKFLGHFDGADEDTSDTSDDAGARAISRAGNGHLESDQKKFGATAYAGTASGENWMKAGDSADWDVGTGDYTLDAQVYLAGYTGGTATIVSIGAGLGGGTSKGIEIDYGSTTSFRVWHNAGNCDSYSTASNTGAWHHWRVQRKSGVLSVWRDGTYLAHGGSYSQACVERDVSGSSEGFQIGGADALGNSFSINGYVDEVRFDNVALNATDDNFTAPTKAYGGKSGGPIVMITTG
jgi:hypothetical protein